MLGATDWPFVEQYRVFVGFVVCLHLPAPRHAKPQTRGKWPCQCELAGGLIALRR